MNFVISIGNSDNKLTQQEWSKFAEEVKNALFSIGCCWPIMTHFYGASAGDLPWQNACWLCEITKEQDVNKCIDAIRMRLRQIAQDYNQDSIFFLIGCGEFIKSAEGK